MKASVTSQLIILLSLGVITTSLPSSRFKRQNVPLESIPVPVTCPTTPLVRSARNGISRDEATYIKSRKRNTDTALRNWLKGVDSAFDARDLPSIGLTTSGGGLRSLLSGAGLIQSFDARDGSYPTSGLYQALTYHSGLSGGAWLVGSLAGNNWPTISSIKASLWESTLATSLPELINPEAIIGNLLAKNASGFAPTLVDAYSDIIALYLLPSSGASTTLSGLTTFSNFSSSLVPYPIITTIEIGAGQWLPNDGSAQFEIHPFEYGSWDDKIAAFSKTMYMGTSLSDGSVVPTGSCIQNYDSLAYVMGTSSSLFSILYPNLEPQNPGY